MRLLIFINSKLRSPPKFEIDYQYVDFNSTKLDDLMLIAKYRILDFPTTLVIDLNGKILLRMRGVVSNKQISDLLYC